MTQDAIQFADGDPAEPLTRGEFNEGLALIADAFNRVATKQDLKGLRSDLQSTEERLTAKIDELGDQLVRHIDAAVESRQIDLGAAKSEIVEAQGEHLERLDDRIEILERHAGLPTDS